MINIAERPIDLVKFMTTPRCKKNYKKGNARCLFSALVEAFGFEWVDKKDIQNTIYLYTLLIDSITREAISWNLFQQQIDKLMDDYTISITGIPKTIFAIGFTQKVIWLYDNNFEIEAIDHIFALIDRLPKTENSPESLKVKEAYSKLPCIV
jgi:hypothetical protein